MIVHVVGINKYWTKITVFSVFTFKDKYYGDDDDDVNIYEYRQQLKVNIGLQRMTICCEMTHSLNQE